MNTPRTSRSLILAACLALAAAACQKAPDAPATAGAPAAPATAAAPAADAAAPDVAPVPKVEICKLLSAAEVSAIMGKTLIQNGCDYGLDPAAKEKALADMQGQMGQAPGRVAGGDMAGMMKGMMGAQQKAGNAMKDQMMITVDATRDDQTEESIKAIYAKTGGTARGTLAPEKHGLNGFLDGFDELSGIGDWAFAVNGASVNMGAGFSIRGRILQARKGPWHVTINCTLSPDPGAAALDAKMSGVAKALIAKL